MVEAIVATAVVAVILFGTGIVPIRQMIRNWVMMRDVRRVNEKMMAKAEPQECLVPTHYTSDMKSWLRSQLDYKALQWNKVENRWTK